MADRGDAQPGLDRVAALELWQFSSEEPVSKSTFSVTIEQVPSSRFRSYVSVTLESWPLALQTILSVRTDITLCLRFKCAGHPSVTPFPPILPDPGIYDLVSVAISLSDLRRERTTGEIAQLYSTGQEKTICLMRKAFVAVVILIVAISLAQESAKLERTVAGRALKSSADPAVTLQIGEPFEYAGGQTIDIFHVAAAEQHFFVDARPDKAIRRFYWIQFEHYYPSNNHTYDYSGIKQETLKFGPIDFLADTTINPKYFTGGNRPGSDSEAAQKFLAGKGYKVAGKFVRTRMFYLTDSSKRKELMVIYGEAMQPDTPEEQARSNAPRHAQEFLKIE